MKNKNLTLFLIARALYEVYFWGVVAIPFYLYKGFSLEKAFWFIGIYAYMIIALEFPTGVIGDKYGHKKSIILSNIFTALGFFMMLFNSNFWVFIAATFAMALGNTMASGSDVAFLKSISKNFKKDYKTFRYVISTTLILSYALAGFVGALKLEHPIYLSIIANILAVIFLIAIKEDTKSQNPLSLIKTAKISFTAVSKMKHGISLMFLLALLGGIAGSSKTIIGSFEEIFNIDLKILGILISTTVGARTLGIYLEKHSRLSTKLCLSILVMLTMLSAIIGFNFPIGISMFLSTLVVTELVYFRIKFKISEAVEHKSLASVLSLASLARRAVVGALIFVAGIFAAGTEFYRFYLLAGATYFIIFLILSKIFSYIDK